MMARNKVTLSLMGVLRVELAGDVPGIAEERGPALPLGSKQIMRHPPSARYSALPLRVTML
jgi:hypothetical protein